MSDLVERITSDIELSVMIGCKESVLFMEEIKHRIIELEKHQCPLYANPSESCQENKNRVIELSRANP